MTEKREVAVIARVKTEMESGGEEEEILVGKEATMEERVEGAIREKIGDCGKDSRCEISMRVATW